MPAHFLTVPFSCPDLTCACPPLQLRITAAEGHQHWGGIPQLHWVWKKRETQVQRSFYVRMSGSFTKAVGCQQEA